MDRDFKGVWIPKEIWLNKDLNIMEKLFLIEIDSLDNENGCFASNDYFSEFFGLSKSRCSEIINGLVKKKILSIELKYKPGSKAVEKRIVRVFDKAIWYSENRMTPFGFPKGYSEKAKDNNTLINNTSTNNINIPFREIVEYLNLKANTKYKATSNKTKDIIKARVNEKFTFDDFKIVIDKKCNEWLGTDMEKFLRPETLFSNKFEGYLNQKGGTNGGTRQNPKESKGKWNYEPKPTTGEPLTAEEIAELNLI